MPEAILNGVRYDITNAKGREERQGHMTLPELEALMRKHRMTIEYGGENPAQNAFRAAASAQDETWDEVAECYGPTLSDAIIGLVAQMEGA